jgi:predicted Zn-dependent peptidase
MEYYGLTELTEASFKTPQEKIAKIEAVTAEEVQKLASDLVDKNKLTVAVLGPFDETVEKEKILGLIGQ